MCRKQAFLLIETLVAILLFSMSALVIISLNLSRRKLEIQLTKKTRELNCAINQIELREAERFELVFMPSELATFLKANNKKAVLQKKFMVLIHGRLLTGVAM